MDAGVLPPARRELLREPPSSSPERAWNYTSAYVNDADGSQARVRTVEPRMAYDPRTRFVRKGELLLTMESGEERVIEVEALGESGFFLRTAGYGDWAGALHGAWRGKLHVDGEYIADCWDDEHLVAARTVPRHPDSGPRR